MKIINRKKFLKMPLGTVYAKIEEKWITGDLSVKHESLENDWYYQSFNWVDAHDDVQAIKRLEDMLLNGSSYPVEQAVSRDGLYEQDVMFLIYEKEDINYITKQLTL